jgi:hypothetical protein
VAKNSYRSYITLIRAHPCLKRHSHMLQASLTASPSPANDSNASCTMYPRVTLLDLKLPRYRFSHPSQGQRHSHILLWIVLDATESTNSCLRLSLLRHSWRMTRAVLSFFRSLLYTMASTHPGFMPSHPRGEKRVQWSQPRFVLGCHTSAVLNGNTCNFPVQ